MNSNRQQRPAGGAEGEARRPIGYWAEFNNWWRTRLSEHGCRPSQTELAEWFDINAPLCWKPEDMPSLKEVRTHAKCLRSTEQVRNYFRKYRAARKAGSTSVRTTAASDSDSEDTGALDSAAISQSRTVGSISYHAGAQPSRSVASNANANAVANASVGAAAAANNALSSLMPFVFGAGGSASLFLAGAGGALANLALQAAAAAGSLPPPAGAATTCTTGATAASPSGSRQHPAKSTATAAATAAAAAAAQQSLQALQALGRGALAQQHGAASGLPPAGLPPRQPPNGASAGSRPIAAATAQHPHQQAALPPAAAAVSGPVISFCSSGLPQHSAHGPGATRSIGGGIVLQLPRMQRSGSGGSSCTSVRMQTGARTPSKHASPAPMGPPAKRQALAHPSCSGPASSVRCLDSGANNAAPGTVPPTAPAASASAHLAAAGPSGALTGPGGLYGSYVGTTCFPPAGAPGMGPVAAVDFAATGCGAYTTHSCSAGDPTAGRRAAAPAALHDSMPGGQNSAEALTPEQGLGGAGSGTGGGDLDCILGAAGCSDDDAIAAVLSPISPGHEDAFFSAWHNTDVEDLLMDLPIAEDGDHDKGDDSDVGGDADGGITLPLPTALPLPLPLPLPPPEQLRGGDPKVPAAAVPTASAACTSGATAPAPSSGGGGGFAAGPDNGRTVTTGAIDTGLTNSTAAGGAVCGNAPRPSVKQEAPPPASFLRTSHHPQQHQQQPSVGRAQAQGLPAQHPPPPHPTNTGTTNGQALPPPPPAAAPAAAVPVSAGPWWTSHMASTAADIVAGLPPIRTRSPVEDQSQGAAAGAGQQDASLVGLQLFTPPPAAGANANANAPAGHRGLALGHGGAFDGDDDGLSPNTASQLFDMLDLPSETPLMPSSPLPAAPPRPQPQQPSQQTRQVSRGMAPALSQQSHHSHHQPQQPQSQLSAPPKAAASASGALRDEASGAACNQYPQSMYPPQWMAPPYGYPHPYQHPHPHPDHPSADPATSASGQPPTALPPSASSAPYPPSMCSPYPYSAPHPAHYTPYGYGPTAPYHPQYPYYYPPGPSSSYDMYGWSPYHHPSQSMAYAAGHYAGATGYSYPPPSHPHHPAGDLSHPDAAAPTLRGSTSCPPGASGPPEASSQRVRAAAAAARMHGAHPLACLPPPMPAEPLMPGRYVWQPTAGSKARKAPTASVMAMAEGGGEFGAALPTGTSGGDAVSAMHSGAAAGASAAAAPAPARTKTGDGVQASYCSRGPAGYSQSVGFAKAAEVTAPKLAASGGETEEYAESCKGSRPREAAATAAVPHVLMPPPPPRPAVQRTSAVDTAAVAAAGSAEGVAGQAQGQARVNVCHDTAGVGGAAPPPQQPSQQAALPEEEGLKGGESTPAHKKDAVKGADIADAQQAAVAPQEPTSPRLQHPAQQPSVPVAADGDDPGVGAPEDDAAKAIDTATVAADAQPRHGEDGSVPGAGSAYDDADLLDLSSITVGLFSPPASAVQTSQATCAGGSRTWGSRATAACTAVTSAPANQHHYQGAASVEATPNAAAASAAAATSAFAFTPIQAYAGTRSHSFAAPPPPPPRFNTASAAAAAPGTNSAQQHPPPPSSAGPVTDTGLDTSIRRLQQQLATPRTVGSPLDCSLLASWLASPASIATFDVCTRLGLGPSPVPGRLGLGPSPGSGHALRGRPRDGEAGCLQEAADAAPNGSEQLFFTPCEGCTSQPKGQEGGLADQQHQQATAPEDEMMHGQTILGLEPRGALAAPAAGPGAAATAAHAESVMHADAAPSPASDVGATAGLPQPDFTAHIRITYVPPARPGVGAGADGGCGEASVALKEGLELAVSSDDGGCAGRAWVPSAAPDKAAALLPMDGGKAAEGGVVDPWRAVGEGGLVGTAE